MDDTQARKLREPFKPAQIGKLPKGGVMLDFVGHAATTDRLLQVDPEWTWEPLALTAEGLPALDRAGNLWIRLTICGVTRLGVGDGHNAKECIGDAIRNAAMRFGVALDLWAKQDLLGDDKPVEDARPKAAARPKSPPPAAEEKNTVDVYTVAATDALIDKLVALAEERGGDPVKVRTAAGTAREQGKLDSWLPQAMLHWDKQPVATEFEKKAADTIVAGAAAQAQRAEAAQAGREKPVAA